MPLQGRCDIRGEYHDGSVCMLGTNGKRRSDSDFDLQICKEHHKGFSALQGFGVSMGTNFFIETCAFGMFRDNETIAFILERNSLVRQLCVICGGLENKSHSLTIKKQLTEGYLCRLSGQCKELCL